MNGIFQSIQANRKEATLATHEWGVYKIGSNKKLLKKPQSTFKTQEEAEKKVLYYEELNPGKKFVAKAL